MPEDPDANVYESLVGKKRGGGSCFLEYEAENGRRHVLLDLCIKLGKFSQKCDVYSEELISGACASSCCRRGCAGGCARRCGAALAFILCTVCASQIGFYAAVGYALLAFPLGMAVLHARLHRKGSALDPEADSLFYCGLGGIFLSVVAWLCLPFSQGVVGVCLLTLPATLVWMLFWCRRHHPPPELEDAGYLGLYVRRGKHCVFCREVRTRFDHHCLWINACVHSDTHLSFVQALALGEVCSLLFPLIALSSLMPSGSMRGLRSAFEDAPLVVTVALIDCVVWVGVTAVLAMQLYCISVNRTVNEYMNSKRYFVTEMRPPPPNRGWRTNIASFLRRDWRALEPKAAGEEVEESIESSTVTTLEASTEVA